MTDGVLLAAYGTAADLDDVARYLAHIRGKEPTREETVRLRARYAAVGGSTPLTATTLRQAALLQAELGPGARVEVGMRHSPPFIEDAARELVAAGVRRGVVLPLAAQDSRISVGGYHKTAKEAFAALPRAPPFAYVHGFATHPALLQSWAERVTQGLAALPAAARSRSTVLFTAHSLPEKVLGWGDPYPAQVRATCEGVAKLADLEVWEQCYQSAVGPDWLGPDVLPALDDLARRGVKGVVVAPIGFVSDHLETLYDLDTEAAERARKHSMAFVRCPAPNDDPRFITTLADTARAHMPA